jgi:AraC-like DNA-binding protein
MTAIFTEPVIKARVFDGMREFLAPYKLGLDPILRAVGIEPARIVDLNTSLPIKAVATVFEVAAGKSGEACFGLKYALAYPPGGSGPLGQLILHAPTLRDAAIAFPKFSHGFATPSTVEFHEAVDGDGILEWIVPVDLAAASIQYVCFITALATWRLRAVAGADWQPRQVDLTHRELPCHELAATVFGPNIRYDAPSVRVVLDRASLDRRAKVQDPRLYDALIMAGEADMTGVASPGDIVTRVRRRIHGMLTNGAPDLDVVAATLRLQPRALQWQLSQAGTSYERVLGDTRRLTAEAMLTSSDLSMTQIALAVGFSDSSSFTRACKAWFGMSPSAFRSSARRRTGSHPEGEAGDDRSGQEPADD